jgi:hypothetical protein
MEPLIGQWKITEVSTQKTYICGYCGAKTGSILGFSQVKGFGEIYICGGCNRPTFFDNFLNTQTPSPIFGNPVLHLPPDLEILYNEARRCFQIKGFTAAVLVCRKILMHIAVDAGANPNQNFLSYVEYLANNGYIPPNGKVWVDQIRKTGNEANHEIVIMTLEDAMELLTFVEMLLKLVFEFPARMSRSTP